MRRAYIDIETYYVGEAQDPFRDYKNHEITIVGILIARKRKGKTIKMFHQLIGPDITKRNILDTLKNCDELVTYNGRSKPDDLKGYIGFDFGVIAAVHGIVLDELFPHIDLAVECWRKKLYGGLKAVEKKLFIERILPHKDGNFAIEMWKKFKETGESVYLELLLAYNKEDVYNLFKLQEVLESM